MDLNKLIVELIGQMSINHIVKITKIIVEIGCGHIDTALNDLLILSNSSFVLANSLVKSKTSTAGSA